MMNPPAGTLQAPIRPDVKLRLVCGRGHFLGRWPADLPLIDGDERYCHQCKDLTTPRV